MNDDTSLAARRQLREQLIALLRQIRTEEDARRDAMLPTDPRYLIIDGISIGLTRAICEIMRS